MAYYLSMDGIDDKIQIPAFAFDEVRIEVSLIDVGHNTDLVDSHDGTTRLNIQNVNDGYRMSFDDFYEDGVAKAFGSPVTYGTRIVLRGVNLTSITPVNGHHVFAHYGGAFDGECQQGNIYSLQYYNSDVLVAEYDIANGNVNDLSGNGNHATLTGGTFVDDGTGGENGTDVSHSFATQQSIYADRQTNAPTAQSITADRSYAFSTKQSIYTDRSYAFNSEQDIYADRSYSYPTAQSLYADYVLYSASFPTAQSIYADRAYPFATMQFIYANRQWNYSTEIVIYDPTGEVVGTITLSGRRVLGVELQGSRELIITLQGSREMICTLGAGLVTIENQNIEMFAGDTKNVVVTVTDEDGETLDLTQATVKWAIKKSVSHSEQKVYKDTTDGITTESGTFTISLEPNDTAELPPGVYYHEAELTDVLGKVSTIMTGKATIHKSGV